MNSLREKPQNRSNHWRIYYSKTDIYLGGKHSLRVMTTDSPTKPLQLRPLAKISSERMVGAGMPLRMNIAQLDELLRALLKARRRITDQPIASEQGMAEASP